MKLINSKLNLKIILMILSVFLLIIIYNWIDYLVQNNYIDEGFENIAKDTGSPETSHTVNLPLPSPQQTFRHTRN